MILLNSAICKLPERYYGLGTEPIIYSFVFFLCISLLD